MADMQLTKSRLFAGTWEGRLSTAPGFEGMPQLIATHLEQEVAPVELAPVPESSGLWEAKVALPASILTDGVQTILISDAASGDLLTSLTIVTGEPLEDDIRSEIDLLRAELDMLKKAFRRHCLETG